MSMDRLESDFKQDPENEPTGEMGRGIRMAMECRKFILGVKVAVRRGFLATLMLALYNLCLLEWSTDLDLRPRTLNSSFPRR